MIKLFDRVKVNIPTTGTGDITFGAAASTAFLTPAEAGVLDSDEVRYVIVDGLDFEEGVGLIKDTVATMERTVTKSKIGGVVGTSALDLSGTAVLALSASAADILTPDDNLASVKDADEALSNIGGTAVGKALFKAEDESDVLTALPSAYHRDNIIGPVGWDAVNEKNTGAIIEYGETSTGDWCKFADGTMIVWGKTSYWTFTNQTIGTAWGQIFTRSAGIPITFPASFLAGTVPGTSASVSSENLFSPGVLQSISASGFTFWPTAATSISNQTVPLSFCAVGRWRA